MLLCWPRRWLEDTIAVDCSGITLNISNMKYQIKFTVIVYIPDVGISGGYKIHMVYVLDILLGQVSSHFTQSEVWVSVSIFSLCHLLNSRSTSTSQGEVPALSMS